MRSRYLLALSLLVLVPGAGFAQTAPTEGLRENPPGVHAFVNATIVVAPGNVLERGTLVIRNGVVQAVGADVQVPSDARVWDLEGHTLYPGFIDAHSGVGMAEPRLLEDRGPNPWNPQLRAHLDAGGEFQADADAMKALRSQGFAVAHVVPQHGVFRGSTALLSLGDGVNSERVLNAGLAQSVSFSRDTDVGPTYPTSAMGGIAFIRQVLYDADWYGRAHAAYRQNPQGLRRPETNAALAALERAARGDQPLLFEAGTEEEYLRALRFRDEFPIDVWVRGSGNEYRIVDAMAGNGVPLIVPLAFPDAPDVGTPEDALNVSLEELREWYRAPENPGRLSTAEIQFAFTADGLGDDTDHFLPNLRKAVGAGLDRNTALAALTTTPADLLGLASTHGTLESGKVANLVVVDGDLFDEGAEVRDVWVDGRRYLVSEPPAVDPRGRWVVTAHGAQPMRGQLNLTGTVARPSGNLTIDGQPAEVSSVSFEEPSRRLRVQVDGGSLGMEGVIRLTATVSGEELHGWGDLPDGSRVTFSGERAEPFTDTDGANGDANGDGGAAPARARLTLADRYPDMDFGRSGIPDRPAVVLVRNATVWTMGPQGILEGADLLVRDGRVAAVGHGLDAPADAVVIDAAGRHVTPGLIDAHLHSGSSGGVNETGSAIVPEVRLGDVLTSQNIWMYRQLAGGLTTAHVMHGSANPIGGQNQHVKMRWGALPEELKFEGAPRTVKFALGENPTRREGRYPDTRMGVHQIIRDHFTAAREYEARWAEWEANSRGIPPRVDLRMQAIVDILNRDILVQSHSYRQDEILMLMRLAEEFDFHIEAFHHGVEAYMVAPELREHGAGAVVWSDWGSFKIEAYDATVYNARLLHEQGVVTSLHSDNSQLASRMNWEAGKMVRAGMDEEDALALITINTAILLGIDDRVGSLEEGKDADFVIWSGHPLSTASHAQQTWLDGRRYFDIEEDRELRRQVEAERAQLIQAVLNGN